MRLPRFKYEQPLDLQGIVTTLSENPGARVLAGGTDLLVNMKHRIELPTTLVSLNRVQDLRRIHEEGGDVIIGARVGLKAIQDSQLLANRFPALVQAARSVGSYHHQTMGTLGGNLCQSNRCRFFNQSWQWRQARSLCYKAGGEDCHVIGAKNVCYSAYSGDMAPALLVLDASVRASGLGGAREFPLPELYSGDGKHPLTLQHGEVITEVRIPLAAAGQSRYEKFSHRGAIDFPVVGAAVWGDNGLIRVAFTAVDRAPVRALALETHLETHLTGTKVTDESVREAVALAGKAARIAPTTVHPPPYKRELMGALVVKALRGL